MIGNATWCNTYSYNQGNLENHRIAIYKEYMFDYPSAAHSEKLTSLMGKTMLDNCRVPDIDIVNNLNAKYYQDYPNVLSYQLLDTNIEEFHDMHSIAFSRFTRGEINNYPFLSIEELMECLRNVIKDDTNYEEVKKSFVELIIFDSITNNPDRHLNNWALVRSKNTNQYSPAIFDHSTSFANMVFDTISFQSRWAPSHLTTSSVKKR